MLHCCGSGAAPHEQTRHPWHVLAAPRAGGRRAEPRLCRRNESVLGHADRQMSLHASARTEIPRPRVFTAATTSSDLGLGRRLGELALGTRRRPDRSGPLAVRPARKPRSAHVPTFDRATRPASGDPRPRTIGTIDERPICRPIDVSVELVPGVDDRLMKPLIFFAFWTPALAEGGRAAEASGAAVIILVSRMSSTLRKAKHRARSSPAR